MSGECVWFLTAWKKSEMSFVKKCLIINLAFIISLICFLLLFGDVKTYYQDHYSPLLWPARNVRPAPAADTEMMLSEEVLGNTSSNNSRRFTFTRKVSEQMTMAMSHTMQLARVATEWQARTVMPFLQDEHLEGLPMKGTVTLDLLYNVPMLNRLVKAYDIFPFVSFDYFIRESNRTNVYFFYAYYGKGGDGPVVERCRLEKEKQEYMDTMQLLNQEAIKRGLPQFTLSPHEHCCRVLSSKPFVPDDFIKGCNIERNLKDITYIINDWRGYSPVDLKSFRLFAPNYIHKNRVPNFDLPYSKQVTDYTRDFTNLLCNNEDFIGVHIRAQKMYIRHNRNKNFNDQKCISDFLETVHQTTSQYPDIKHVVYISDSYTGKYNQLLNISFSRFNPSDFNSSDFNAAKSRALIAQVEQNFLSKARVLIMCGGGSFEKSISLRYETNNPSGKIIQLCSDNSSMI